MIHWKVGWSGPGSSVVMNEAIAVINVPLQEFVWADSASG